MNRSSPILPQFFLCGIIRLFCGPIVRTAALVILVLCLSGCYLVRQGRYLIRHQTSAVRIDHIMADTALSQDRREFLSEVESIRRYAFDSLGLVRNSNYSRLVNVDSSYLLAMLSAADSASFTVKKWCYPFLGCFPLRSYFDINDALRAARRLAAKGYEINIDKVSGYSTLGIFRDPVYSFMSDYPVYSLANYIFHEQTHATVYFSNVQFSEELATFIGSEGALRYLRMRFGADSPEYLEALRLIKDEKSYLTLLRGLISELERVYDQPISRSEKIRLKKETILGFKRRVVNGYDSLFSTESFRGIEKCSFNNAFLAVRRTYNQDLELFERLSECYGGDLRRVVEYAVSLKRRRGDPKELLRKEIMEHQAAVEVKKNIACGCDIRAIRDMY